MITLKDYLEAVNYRITGGSEHTWDCFGHNSRYLDSNDREDHTGKYSMVCIFDAETQVVYVVEAWDYVNDRVYRWVNPEHESAYRKAHTEHNVDYKEASDEKTYIDLDVAEDMLEKINAIVNNLDYDERVKVPVDFSDEELLQYMKLAHEMDITFNELVERALREAIDEHKRDPEGFAKRAKEYINED